MEHQKEKVYVAYYFRDYRKENHAEVFGVFRKMEDAIERIKSKIDEEGFSLEDEDIFEDLEPNMNSTQTDVWMARINEGEENFIVEMRDLE